MSIGASNEPRESVVVTSRSVPSGATITASDVTRMSLPTAALPDSCITDPDTVIGRTAIATLARGSIVTSGLVVSSETNAAPGRVITTVSVAEHAIGLVSPGDTVDLLGSYGGTTEVLATAARVVTIPASTQTTLGSTNKALLIVEIAQIEAPRVVEAALVGQIGLTRR